MHSRIFQVSMEPIEEENYICEAEYCDHWFTREIANYVSDDCDRDGDIKRLANIAKGYSVGEDDNGEYIIITNKEEYFSYAYVKFMEALNKIGKPTLEELRVLSKLEERDKESFEERSHFFTKDVVVYVLNDYMEKLEDYIDQLPTKKCKGIPYKHIKGMDIFVDDLDKKIYEPMRKCIFAIKYAKNYFQMYRLLNNFMFKMIKLPSDTPKSKAWIDAYKGEGAYYTMKNLLMFHNCFVEVENTGLKLYGTKAVSYISSKLDEYKGEGWRMFAFMKKVIAINNFDYGARMHELGVKGY